MPPGFPAIVRPTGLARATTPGPVPEPEHHHLPAWVRRAYGQARPVLADLDGALSGDARERLAASVAEVTRLINTGKFSQAFRYAELIALGEQLLDTQRLEQAEAAKAQRALDAARRRVGERLREGSDQLSQDVASRLNRSLRSAGDAASIAAVGSELDQALGSARTVQERRREREIHRTRTRIQRTLPKAPAEQPAEDWQDVLRRLQEQMTAGSTSV